MNILHVHIVCHAGNSHLVEHACRAAQRAWPGMPITLLDDEHAPAVSPAAYAKLDVEYRTTGFARRGNLRGRECLRGLLREYCKSLKRSQATYIVKLDPDTLVLHPDALQGLIFQGVDYATHSTLGSPLGGGVILMSTFAVHKLLRAVCLCPIADNAREDMTLGGLALATGIHTAVLDGNTPCVDRPVFFTGLDTARHGDESYTSRMALLVAFANVGTSQLTGATRDDEACMAATLLHAVEELEKHQKMKKNYENQ